MRCEINLTYQSQEPPKILGYGAIYEKVPFFTNFYVRLRKKYWARVSPILMPPTFPIASLNRYTPKFSGAA